MMSGVEVAIYYLEGSTYHGGGGKPITMAYYHA